jgi:hypothetical protein
MSDNKLEIVSAIWHDLDVTHIVRSKFLTNNAIRLSADNTHFTDPAIGKSKLLKLNILYNGEHHSFEINEGANFTFPKNKYTVQDTLILTSCNRVEQVLFAAAVNSRIIKKPFNLVVADCSTPDLSTEEGVKLHISDDPYNLIKSNNYSPNWRLFEQCIPKFPNIIKHQVIHISPRLPKQIGEATLMALGITAANMMGSKYSLKLTGVCHMKYDILSDLPNLVKDNDIATIKRTGFNQPSTRVCPFRTDKMNEVLAREGFDGWVREYDFIERKLDTITKVGKTTQTTEDERGFIVDEGIGRNDHRHIITENLRKHNLLDSDDYFIRKFLAGEIW